ncbi:Tic22 family protein [Pseudanabaena sp. FACHB-2040]|uniref:Tic22 family protein n=1 Tax=Pseudanabaena sp. FACHB-2040 TaxID=2692859 RepID=UPI001688015C|nr:Tic22 family protein [Pseudanabaena sp. FACHB-2040]MBD2256736.1 hypothetical protein [Pseudanabaena sp. FACHB-2040]
MKKLLRSWSVGGLATLVLTGVGLLAPLSAEALPEDQIVDKLQQVPVFLILNSEGQPLTAAASADAAEVKVPVVFLDGETAQEFLEQAQQEDANAQVALVDLGTLFQETQSQETGPAPVMYFPEEDELTAAATIQDDFRGVPLFFARRGEDGPYLTITQDGVSSLPMFFSRQDLQTLITRYTQENPGEARAIAIEVLSLEWLLAAMATSDDPQLDEQLQRIRLFPSSEVLQYLRSQQQEQSTRPATSSQR